MLIRQAVLAQIAAGKVRCAYRRWARPTVKAGGTLKTAVGLLRIDAVTPVSLASISAKDARLAGHESKAALLAELAGRKGLLYRIELHLDGPDPRLALREEALTAADVEALRAKLARLDAASPTGPWTRRVLHTIADHPQERAVSLAQRLEVPKDWLKPNVRKLKNLGLTISHEIGYELSPRGAHLLALL